MILEGLKPPKLQEKYSWLFEDKSEYFYYVLNMDNPSKPFIISKVRFYHKYFAKRVVNNFISPKDRPSYAVVDGKFAKKYRRKPDKKLTQKKVNSLYSRPQMIRLITYTIEYLRQEKYTEFFSQAFEGGTYREYFSHRTGKRKRKNGSVEKNRTLSRKLKGVYVYYFMDFVYGISDKELRKVLNTV